MVLEVVHKWTPQSTGCGNRGGVENGVAAGQGVRWECCEKCSGPRLLTEGLTTIPAKESMMAENHSTQPTTPPCRGLVSVMLASSNDLTWADLRRFVALAGDIPDTSPVEFVYDDQYIDVLLGIRVVV